MPSIVIKSSAFAASGLALNSQEVTEEPSGLINVRMVFTTTAEKNETVSRLFYLDAPPPIFPSSVNKDELQLRQLYMINRSFALANGMVQITADYAGALNRALSVPYISMGREIKSIDLKVFAGVQIIMGGTFYKYDFYTIGITSGVKSYLYAQVGPSIYNIADPTPKELFFGAYFIRKNIAAVVVGEGGTDAPSVIDRTLSASDLVLKYVKSSTINKDISYTAVTPSVSVQSTRFFLTLITE